MFTTVFNVLLCVALIPGKTIADVHNASYSCSIHPFVVLARSIFYISFKKIIGIWVVAIEVNENFEVIIQNKKGRMKFLLKPSTFSSEENNFVPDSSDVAATSDGHITFDIESEKNVSTRYASLL